MIENLLSNNYEIVENNQIADVYVINTCTVTNMSDRKSRQMIQKAKKNNANSIIIVTGCLAQVNKEEIEKIKEIDLILGNEEKKDLAKYINKYINEKNKIYVSDIMKVREYKKEDLSTLYENTKAILKVQDGCNNYCSYCLIPYARGRERSKKIDDVLNEVRNISKNNYKEIVLTGIHISAYGKDLENTQLIDLIEEISTIEGIERISIGSLDPVSITQDFLDRLKNVKQFIPHFHLSLQSACNDTLKRMNRHYTIEDFKNKVKLIRNIYDNANITTDIIVGFPGETDEEFEITYNNLKEINFNKMHIFKYSVRKGTVAEKMDNQIVPEVKNDRSEKLIKLSEENESLFAKKNIGEIVEILIEEKEDKYVKGYTKNYLHTKTVIKDNININEIINAKVIQTEKNVLICEKI